MNDFLVNRGLSYHHIFLNTLWFVEDSIFERTFGSLSVSNNCPLAEILSFACWRVFIKACMCCSISWLSFVWRVISIYARPIESWLNAKVKPRGWKAEYFSVSVLTSSNSWIASKKFDWRWNTRADAARVRMCNSWSLMSGFWISQNVCFNTLLFEWASTKNFGDP